MAERKLKENQHVMPQIDLEKGIVTFHVKGHLPIPLHMDRLHPDIIRRAAMVGMAQVRIVDAAAVGMTDKDGNIIPEADRIQMKYENMNELVRHYESGTAEWSRVSEAGPKGGILFKALCNLYAERTPEGIRTWLDARSKKEQAALRADPKVKAEIDRIEAEMGKAANVDTTSLLASL